MNEAHSKNSIVETTNTTNQSSVKLYPSFGPRLLGPQISWTTVFTVIGAEGRTKFAKLEKWSSLCRMTRKVRAVSHVEQEKTRAQSVCTSIAPRFRASVHSDSSELLPLWLGVVTKS